MNFPLCLIKRNKCKSSQGRGADARWGGGGSCRVEPKTHGSKGGFSGARRNSAAGNGGPAKTKSTPLRSFCSLRKDEAPSSQRWLLELVCLFFLIPFSLFFLCAFFPLLDNATCSISRGSRRVCAAFRISKLFTVFLNEI